MKYFYFFLLTFFLSCSAAPLENSAPPLPSDLKGNSCSGWAPTYTTGENIQFYFTPDGNANIVVPECTVCKYSDENADICQCRENCPCEIWETCFSWPGTPPTNYEICLNNCGAEPSPLPGRSDTIPKIQFWVFIYDGTHSELPQNPTWGTYDDYAYNTFLDIFSGDVLQVGFNSAVKFDENYYDEWLAGNLCAWVWFEIKYTYDPPGSLNSCCFWSFPVCPLNG